MKMENENFKIQTQLSAWKIIRTTLSKSQRTIQLAMILLTTKRIKNSCFVRNEGSALYICSIL